MLKKKATRKKVGGIEKKALTEALVEFLADAIEEHKTREIWRGYREIDAKAWRKINEENDALKKHVKILRLEVPSKSETACLIIVGDRAFYSEAFSTFEQNRSICKDQVGLTFDAQHKERPSPERVFSIEPSERKGEHG